MNCVIRTDASGKRGSGHVMRCLTLADALRNRGSSVRWICGEVAGHMIDFLRGQSYEVFAIPSHLEQDTTGFATGDLRYTREVLGRFHKKTDWLVVDHYELDSRWESEVRPFTRNIMVIDDLSDRAHDCDLLLDQNLHKPEEKRYSGLAPETCRLLLGTRFALLRPEFSEVGQNPRVRDGSIRRLFIYFGAADPDNLTGRALEAFKNLNNGAICVDVVVGEANPHRELICREYAALSNVTFHGRVDNMAQLMNEADLAIGAGGITTWERCALGLPALMVSIAPNQDSNGRNMDSVGASLFLGKSSGVTPSVILDGLKKCMGDRKYVSSMSQTALKLVDGKGVNRVLAELEA